MLGDMFITIVATMIGSGLIVGASLGWLTVILILVQEQVLPRLNTGKQPGSQPIRSVGNQA